LETGGTATAPWGSGWSAGAAGTAATLLGAGAEDGGGRGRRVYTCVMMRAAGAGGVGEVARGGNPGGGPLVAAGDVQAARSAGGTYKRRGVGDEGAVAARGAGTSVDGDAARGAGAGVRAPRLRSAGGT